MRFDRDQIEEDLALIEERLSQDEIFRHTLGTAKSVDERLMDTIILNQPSSAARTDSEPSFEDIRYLALITGQAYRLFKQKILDGQIPARFEEPYYSYNGEIGAFADLNLGRLPKRHTPKIGITQELGDRSINFAHYFFGGFELVVGVPNPLFPEKSIPYTSARRRLNTFTASENRISTFVTESFIAHIQATRN